MCLLGCQTTSLHFVIKSIVFVVCDCSVDYNVVTFIGGYAVTLVGSGLTAEDITIKHPEGGCEIVYSNDTSISCILQPSVSITFSLHVVCDS